MPTFASQTTKRGVRRGISTFADIENLAKIAQLVEHDLAKVGVAGSSPVFRSKFFEFDACRELKPQTPINMRK